MIESTIGFRIHDCCKCPGAKKAPGHHQPSWWFHCDYSTIWIIVHNKYIASKTLTKPYSRLGWGGVRLATPPSLFIGGFAFHSDKVLSCLWIYNYSILLAIPISNVITNSYIIWWTYLLCITDPLCGISTALAVGWPHMSPEIRKKTLVIIHDKGQWRGYSTFSLICAWTNGWANTRDAGDLRRHCAHYDFTVMIRQLGQYWANTT